MTLFDVVVSLAVTWGIGLLPAVVARYLWVRAPLTQGSANWIAGISCVTFFLLFRILNAAVGVNPEDTTRGAVWFLVFAASRWIMTREHERSTTRGLSSALSSTSPNDSNGLNAEAAASAPEAPKRSQIESPTTASDDRLVLYDERFDWLAMYLIALVPLWLAYSFQVSLILFPTFAMVAALRPMQVRLGSLTWSGVFAAGASLLLSPLLLLAALDGSSDLFDDVSVRDQTLNGIRAFVYPAAGLAIMVHAWFRAPRFRDANGSIPKRIRFWRWLGFAVAGLVLVAFVAGSLLQAHLERTDNEVRKKLMELDKKRKQIAKAMPLYPVTRNWLIGEWAWENYGSCYDSLNFRASGKFSSGK